MVADVIQTTSNTAAWVAGIGAAAGGVGAAIAATFSYRSAQESKRTGERASEALALAIEPGLWVRSSFDSSESGLNPQLRHRIAIKAVGRWSMTDVRAEFHYRDGTMRHFACDRLVPGGGSWEILVEGVSGDVSPAPWGDMGQILPRVVISFSDQADIARYEMTLLGTESMMAEPITSERASVRRLHGR